MIHQYKLGGLPIVLDTCSGAVHVVDDIAYDIIGRPKLKQLSGSDLIWESSDESIAQIWGGKLTAVRSKITVDSSEGSVDVGGNTSLTEKTDVLLHLGKDAVYHDNMQIDVSRLVAVLGRDARVTGIVDVTDAVLNIDAGHGLRIADYTEPGKPGEGILNVWRSPVTLLARTGDAEISHLNAYDTITSVRANSGIFRGETVYMETSSVTLDSSPFVFRLRSSTRMFSNSRKVPPE